MDLSVEVAGLTFKTPLVLASGVVGTSLAFFKEIDKYVGAVTTKSLGLKPRAGNLPPVVVELPYGIINAMGLPNPGIERFAPVISEAKRVLTSKVIVSVFGHTSREYAEVAARAEEAGADAVELNLSCPHERLVAQFSHDAGLAAQAVSAASSTLRIPVIAKLSPDIPRVAEIASACERAGAAALTLVNTARAMKIDVHLKRPILSAKFGGLSGPALHPIAVRCVYEAYEAVSVPIIGVGGVSTWEDAVELMLAGATAIGIATAIGKKGSRVFASVLRGVKRYLLSEGLSSPSELVGLAHGE